jgi:hypothetical protein
MESGVKDIKEAHAELMVMGVTRTLKRKSGREEWHVRRREHRVEVRVSHVLNDLGLDALRFLYFNDIFSIQQRRYPHLAKG